VAYHSAPASVRKAELQEKGRIKIKTFEDKEYVLRWIDDRGESVMGIKNTERIMVPTEQVAYIKTAGDSSTFLDVTSLTTYHGQVTVTTLDKKGIQQDYNFIQIQKRDSLIYGIEMLKKDTATIIIPRGEIASIKLENRSASTAGNVIFGLTGALVLIMIIAIIDINKNGLDIDLYGP